MPRLATYFPALEDPDLQDLRQLAQRQGLAVRVSTGARVRGEPPIELYRRDNRDNMLASFTDAAAGLEWLQAGKGASQ